MPSLIKGIGKLIKGIYLATDPSLSDGQEHPITLTSDGRVRVDTTIGDAKEFMVSFRGLAAPNGQFFELVGASGVVGRVVEIYFYKPSANTLFRVRKQSAASTGGTTTANAAVPNDSADTAGLTYKTYTAAPTPGTSVGIPIEVSAVTAADILGWTFGDLEDKPLVVRNGESLTLEVNAAVTVYGYMKVRESAS